MLNVQEYLIEKFKEDGTVSYALNCLKEEFGIKINETEHFVLLKYDQLNSPKMHPIVRECRGLVLDKHTFGVAAKPFNRFFNLGEAEEINGKFDWSDFDAYEKVDGSLAIVWYNYYDNRWEFNTSGSFGDGELVFGKSWSEYIKSCFTDVQLRGLNTSLTYIFEFVSPYNKVIRTYTNADVILLGITNNHSQYEYVPEVVDHTARLWKFKRPERFEFKSVEDVQAFIKQKETEDQTYEGLVLQDCNGLRIKVKSATYLALHHMKGNNNLFLTKNLVPFILAGETDEVIAYFPEAKERINEIQNAIDDLYNHLYVSFTIVKDIEDQKEFALKLQSLNESFTNVLFKMKRNGDMNEDKLKEYFRASEDLIIKILKD